MIDLTQSNAPKARKVSGKRKIVEDSDSDIDIVGGSISQGKRFRGSSPAPEERKGKGRANSGPSEAVMSTWKKGDDDMEPSTKMLALIGFLKEWEASGDKTICYSQCWCPSRHSSVYFQLADALFRDVDARSSRDALFSTWYQNSSLRRKDGQSSSRCHARAVQTDWGA